MNILLGMKKVSFAVNVLFIVTIVNIVNILLQIKKLASDNVFLILEILHILEIQAGFTRFTR